MQIRTTDTGLPTSVLSRASARLNGSVSRAQKGMCDFSYTVPESALACPFDESLLVATTELSGTFRDELKVVVLVGIGGSNLGLSALYRACGAATHASPHAPILVMLDTVSPRILDELRACIEGLSTPKEIVLVVISKSGSTAETRVNAEAAYGMLRTKWGEEAAVSRTIVLSEAYVPLAREARARGFTHVALPAAVGGRWSVFSAVGLVPALLLGLDASGFLEGARAGIRAAVAHGHMNPALQLAVMRAEYYALGYTAHDVFVFEPVFAELGAWLRQLLGESLGKTSVHGERMGISPSVLVGSTDLHSMGQLVFGGPRNRTTTFLSVPAQWSQGPRMETAFGPFTVSGMEGKPAGALMRAIYGGTVAAYRHEQLPFVEVELAALTAREVGAYMALEMVSTMYLAQLLEVNAFDQPAVEAYKTETRKILTS